MRHLVLLALLAAPAFADRAPITAIPIKTVEQDRGIVLVTAKAGTDDGVTAKDTCELVDKKGVVAPVTCTVMSVEKRTSVVKTNAPNAEIRAELLVRFKPAL